MSTWLVGLLLSISACGGSGETANENSASTPASVGEESAPEPPSTTCRVVVDEEGRESRTTRYAFRGGLLEEIIVTDSISSREFTTRYTWDDARHTVRVEKLTEGQESRPAIEMRYTGSRDSGEIVGEQARDGALVERVTWHFDAEARPVRRDHEWLPSDEERSAGMEPRGESDACSYDAAGRPNTFELTLEGEPVLLIFYQYDGDSRYPNSIVEKHLVTQGPYRPNTIADVDGSSQLRVTWPNEARERATRYEGNCEAVFFPAVCSPAAAPR